MRKEPPKRNEQIWADIEHWQLEMAEELGIIEEIRHVHHSLGPRPVLRCKHHRPWAKSNHRSN
ncbi:MAG: hypothetical protein GX033_05395 [Firmicutes bacterium]|nr:hypothetical protein [Bacillota bacterium]